MGEDALPYETDDTAYEKSSADKKSGTASADLRAGRFGATIFHSANLFERFARNHSRSVFLHLISESDTDCTVQMTNTPKALANFSPVTGTPKALTNFSPGFERSENPGYAKRKIRSEE